jgi:WD40 repeat protein
VFNRDESRVLTWSADAARLWAVGKNEPIQTFEQKGALKYAMFNRDESRILTWSGDGTARLWDISLDENIPLDERILDFQVRSATSLYGSGELRSLSLGEWMTASQTLKEMRERRASSK